MGVTTWKWKPWSLALGFHEEAYFVKRFFLVQLYVHREADQREAHGARKPRAPFSFSTETLQNGPERSRARAGSMVGNDGKHRARGEANP